MRLSIWALAVVAASHAVSAWGVAPHIGYAYPAGARQGTVVQVLVGGQSLKGLSGVRLSGEGAQATVVEYGRALTNKHLMELRGVVSRLLKAKRNGYTGVTLVSLLVETETLGPVAEQAASHPLLRNLDQMTADELAHWVGYYGDIKKRQPNQQIAETALIEISVAADAAPGWRDLRLATPAGLTNPLPFFIGTVPEVKEREPNDTEFNLAPAELPVVFNGQAFPGDRDRFSFRAKSGQKVLVQAQARQLVPYLADAVPGWFQATLAVYDRAGKEVAFVDDYRFDPDPVLLFQIPEDDVYTVEIHDALYRGRDDFIYRVTVGELPFVTQIYPLGGQTGERTTVSLSGWNLHRDRFTLDTSPGSDWLRQAVLLQDGQPSNPFPYAVDTLSEENQKEPNDTLEKARKITLPVCINGVIERSDDVDMYWFNGHAGDRLVAEVYARRLGSPLDSILRLTDSAGTVVEWNDDNEDKESGLTTHKADSFLSVQLPSEGKYFLQLSDAQHGGGPAHGYRLRVSPPRPDFALRVTPSCINVGTGRDAAMTVYALRKDGFDGPIDLALRDALPGFTLSGARIPAGRESVRLTLRAPKQAPKGPIQLHLEGSAEVDGNLTSREAVPAEDMMQAFLYRHLVPAREMLVAVTYPNRPAPPLGRADEGTVPVPLGGAVQVTFNTPNRPTLQQVRLELSDPPKGVSLHDMTVVPQGFQFTLKAESIDVGYKDNLIVQAFIESEGTAKGGKPAKQKQRTDIGVLPAVPIEIVQP